MRSDVLFALGVVEPGDLTLENDPLSDGGVGLLVQLVPELVLSGKDQCHGILGIHIIVEEEAQLLQGVALQEMGFVDHGDDPLAVHAADDGEVLVEEPSGGAAVELLLRAELFEHAVVQPA